jgi:hypothetical protein
MKNLGSQLLKTDTYLHLISMMAPEMNHKIFLSMKDCSTTRVLERKTYHFIHSYHGWAAVLWIWIH